MTADSFASPPPSLGRHGLGLAGWLLLCFAAAAFGSLFLPDFTWLTLAVLLNFVLWQLNR